MKKQLIAEFEEAIRKRIKRERIESEKRIKEQDYAAAWHHKGIADGLQESIEILQTTINP